MRIDGGRLGIEPGLPELVREDRAHPVGQVVHQRRHLAAPLRGRRVPEEHREAIRPLLHVGEEGQRGPLQALAR